ncbi:MAG: plastocyanin/azurin family copper-binding protein [Chloroflexota bacterium]|nr:plastocyanin/azurin family copper-binding protein [Chloroflexota bacterium]
MRRRLLLSLLTVPLIALVGMATVSVTVAGDPCFHSTTNRPATTTGATTSVAIADCSFAPTVTVVPVGATVTWKNTSFQGHEVVGSNLEWGAHDKVLQSGDSIGWTFDKAGVYAYSCMLHPGMTGTIVVGPTDTVLASDVQAAPAQTADGTPAAGGASPIPVAAAGGVGLLVGALGAGLLRRRDQAD